MNKDRGSMTMLRYLLMFILCVQISSVFAAQQRVALVIGNSGYENGNDLGDNPLRDAETMASTLKQVGFSVILKKDLNLDDMEQAIQSFGNQLNQNTVALFYFSGHGTQHAGENYLIPIGALGSISAPGHLRTKTVNVDYVLSVMENAKSSVNLVFLDACRNNPFKSLFKGNPPNGLATPKETPSGTLIAYATRAGSVASAGAKGQNSPYIKALVKEILKPNISIADMLTNVRTTVIKSTNNEQAPGYYNELNDTFCFIEPCGQSNQNEANRLRELEQKIIELENQRQANKFNTTQVPIPITVAPATPKPSVEIPRAPEASTPVIAEIIPQKPETPVAVISFRKSFRDKLKDGSLGPEMVWIPGGTFKMGSNDGDHDEKPVHTVSLKSFAMGKYEVTFEEYDKFCEATGREKPFDLHGERGKKPVINVYWYDAKAYAEWISKQTGKDYRLPSEARWEYACRAGSSSRYSFGDNAKQLSIYAWYSNNSGDKTHLVGEKQPNNFGLYDMHGNVLEWLEDIWQEDYSDAPTDGSAWISGKDIDFRVLRGGSWYISGDGLSCSNRVWFEATRRNDSWGFRLSRM